MDDLKGKYPKSEDNRESVYNVIAEKILKETNLYVLDFDANPKKELFINRVNYNKKTLKFKQPIKILIEKINEDFHISQNVFRIKVVDKPFSQAIKRFQKEFYEVYIKVKQEKENGLNILYNSIIDTPKHF